MANQSFSTILEQLGYGTVDESSGKSIPSCEWLFEKEETKELLMWLCNNLKPTNVLLNEDLRQYKELEAQGLTLEGAQLEEALETMKAIDNREDIDSLTQEVANLQQELQKANSRLTHLVSDRAKMATEHAHLTHRSADMTGYNEKLAASSETIHQQVFASSNQIKESLKATDTAINDLVAIHEVPSEIEEESAFLSHLPFESYLAREKQLLQKIEEQLTTAENRVTKDPLSQYDFLGVSDIPPSLSKVEADNTRDGFASELSRLRMHFEKSVLLELDAQMKEAKVPAEEQALREWDDAFEHLTEEDMMNQLIATQEGLATTTQQIQTHIRQTVPQLARTLAQVTVLPVLETDLLEQSDLIMATIDSQSKAISQLGHQKSRLDFLKGNLLHEESQHIQTHTLLEATKEGAKNTVGKKITPPQAPPLSTNIIDTNTPSNLSRANAMIDQFNPSALSIVTTETLAAATKNILQTNLNLNNEKEIMIKEREAMLSQLWLNINSLNKVFFTPQSTLQPLLADSELATANEQLEKLLKILESMLTDVLKFQKAKNEVLMDMYNDLKQRVEAAKINSS